MNISFYFILFYFILGILKICDLGLARIQNKDRVSLTCEGTFAFMPPEVMSTTRILAYFYSFYFIFVEVMSTTRVLGYDGTKWDVYSTAVVLLMMHTLEQPYHDLQAC